MERRPFSSPLRARTAPVTQLNAGPSGPAIADPEAWKSWKGWAKANRSLPPARTASATAPTSESSKPGSSSHEVDHRRRSAPGHGDDGCGHAAAVRPDFAGRPEREPVAGPELPHPDRAHRATGRGPGRDRDASDAPNRGERR